MSDHRDSTTSPKSIGELTENIVNVLATRKEIAKTIEDVMKAEAIVHTVWLALSSPGFGGEDANAVLNTLSEAWEIIKDIRSRVEDFNDAEIRDEVARRAAR